MVKTRNKLTLSYNPEDVNIRIQHFHVHQLMKMIDSKSIDMLDDDFKLLSDGNQFDTSSSLFDDTEYSEISGDDGLQRNSGLWNNIQKSQFIESLMINLPIPLFYFDGSDRPWRIVDGLQRLHTIHSYLHGKFVLRGLEYLTEECEQKQFRDVPGYLRRRILNAELLAYVINPGTPSDVKYNIFKRINTGGLKLNGQEVRNAFFRGVAADYIKSLSKDRYFLKATNNKVSPRRMLDREYVNRFIAFHVCNYEQYPGQMDSFLSNALALLSNSSELELNQIENHFSQTMKRCYELLGDFAFYRIKEDGNLGRQPHKAIFDTLSWNIGYLSEKKYSVLFQNKVEFSNRYKIFLKSDQIMNKAVNDTTGTKNSVSNRFNRLKSFLLNYLT